MHWTHERCGLEGKREYDMTRSMQCGLCMQSEEQEARAATGLLPVSCAALSCVGVPAGYLITTFTPSLRANHPGNLQALTMIAAVNNVVLGVMYQHHSAVCGSKPTQVPLTPPRTTPCLVPGSSSRISSCSRCMAFVHSQDPLLDRACILSLVVHVQLPGHMPRLACLN